MGNLDHLMYMKSVSQLIIGYADGLFKNYIGFSPLHVVNRGGTWTRSLRFRRPTPYPLGHTTGVHVRCFWSGELLGVWNASGVLANARSILSINYKSSAASQRSDLPLSDECKSRINQGIGGRFNLNSRNSLFIPSSAQVSPRADRLVILTILNLRGLVW